MSRLRFSIRSMLIVVLFVGVAVAALRAADDTWDGGVFGIALLTLLTAVLLAIHRTDRRRAYWLGFALFGWTYLVASMIRPIESRLPTSRGLAFIDSKIPGRFKTWIVDLAVADSDGPNTVQAVAFSPQGNTLATSSQGVVRLWDATTGRLLSGPGGSTEDFIRIGHSLLALVMAFVGGHLSRLLYLRGREEGSDSPSDSPAPP